MGDSIRRVAVTGAAGYIAGSLMRSLERQDGIERILAIDVRALNQAYTPKVVFQRHDVTEPMADLLVQHGIDAVVHLAFILAPGHNRSAIRRVNVGGTANVLEACRRAGVRHFVLLSSTTVYGAHPDNAPLLAEDCPARPVNGFQYGEDKAACEELVDQLVRGLPSISATVLRSCPALGPTADNFISRAFARPFLVGVRGYDPLMQFVHEDDVVSILVQCLLQRVSGIYNVAGDGTVRWSEMVGIVGRGLVNLPAPLLYGLTGAAWSLRLQGHSPACGLDFIRYPWTVSTEKIKRELGVTFQHSSGEAWSAYARRNDGAPKLDRVSRL